MKKIALSLIISLFIGINPSFAAVGSGFAHIDINVCLTLMGRADLDIDALYSDSSKLPRQCADSYSGLPYLQEINLDRCMTLPRYEGGISEYEKVPTKMTAMLGCYHLYPNYYKAPTLRVAIQNAPVSVVEFYDTDVVLNNFVINPNRGDITVNKFTFKLDGSERVRSTIVALKLVDNSTGEVIDTTHVSTTSGIAKFDGLSIVTSDSNTYGFSVVADFDGDSYVGEYFRLNFQSVGLNSPDINRVRFVTDMSGPEFFMD